jgi:hypothetical protein
MAGLFGGKAKTPPPPRPVRQPVETDPEIQAAARRTREGALRRTGRLSTMLTSNTQGTAGVGIEKAMIASSGQKLGA